MSEANAKAHARPQVHFRNEQMVVPLCNAVAAYTRSRLTSCPRARSVGGALVATLNAHVSNVNLTPSVLTALHTVLVHLNNEVRQRAALQTCAKGRAVPRLRETCLACCACAARLCHERDTDAGLWGRARPQERVTLDAEGQLRGALDAVAASRALTSEVDSIRQIIDEAHREVWSKMEAEACAGLEGSAVVAGPDDAAPPGALHAAAGAPADAGDGEVDSAKPSKRTRFGRAAARA